MFFFPNKPVRIFDLQKFIDQTDIDGWIVQAKIDGHRAMVFCDEDGNVTVFSRFGKPLTLAKNSFQWLSVLNIPRPFLLDCELTRSFRMVCWDFAFIGGVTAFHLSYAERSLKLLEMVGPAKLKKGIETFEVVETYPAKEYKKILLRKASPELEGLVFKRCSAKDFWDLKSTREVGSMVKFRFKK